MKPGHTYHKNPVPFALTIANPKGKSSMPPPGPERQKYLVKVRRKYLAKKRRNPAKKSSAGVFVIRKPSRNPIKPKTIDLGNNERATRGVFKENDGTYLALGFSRSKEGFKSRAAAERWLERNSRRPNPMKKSRRRSAKKRRNPVMIGGPTRRKAGENKWHHKKGTFIYNPPGKKKRRVKAKRRRNAAKKSTTLSKFFSPNPMKSKKRRRGSRRRSRNPVARSGAKRRSGRRRSSSRRMRNPLPMVRDIFNSDILATTGGVLGGSVFANTVIMKVAMPDSTGAIPVKLWGVDYAPLASTDPVVRLTFATKNALPLFFYKALIGGVTGAVLRRWSPRLGSGVIAGGILAGGMGFLQAQGLINAAGALSSRGTGRVLYPGNGVGLLPGTSTTFTGPAQQFLRNGVPQPRGAGARVGPGTMSTMQAQSEGQFRGAN